jgi:hypothetical protein
MHKQRAFDDEEVDMNLAGWLFKEQLVLPSNQPNLVG